MNLLFDLSKLRKTAVLIVTHDRALAARADKVVRLENGLLAPGGLG
jgi:predicted ABC-type transport system involved in lysophospholipase L1 biosynthesis ATPase subunit